jgi:hypothetical protein
MAKDGREQALVLDVSPSGARLTQGDACEVGMVREFSFELQGELVRVQAEVKHCAPVPEGKGYQLGVQFVGVDPGSRRQIEDFVKRRRRRGRA